MSQRTDRVDELLREELGALIAKELSDPRIGFATITDVETSPDLRHAKVWVSVIGDKADRDETLRALQRSAGFLRHELGQRLRIKRIPELHVRLDDSAERGTRVLHLLHELEAGADPESIAPLDESLPTPVPRLPHEGDAEESGGPAEVVGADGDPGGGSPRKMTSRRGDGHERGRARRADHGRSAGAGAHKPRRHA